MRQERTVQASLFDRFAGHEIGRELKAMSAWLDDHRELASLVAADLRLMGLVLVAWQLSHKLRSAPRASRAPKARPRIGM